MTTTYCTDINMEIIANATIFCGDSTIEIAQYGVCFTDENDQDRMGANEIDTCERFQAAIITACGRAQRAAQYEIIDTETDENIAEFATAFFG